MSRPEHIAPPDLFYNDDEAKKYAYNTRMMEIQTKMTERAIELLNLPQNQHQYILDIGCGSGLSGEVLTEKGYNWVGVDISPSMLGLAIEREVDGDLIYADIGNGMFFRPGTFDACISISVLQWLCQAETKAQNPIKRLRRFFNSLYKCLAAGARAVFQFYPENDTQLRMINNAAMKSGFSGGLVIDYPNSRSAKKYYLCLFAGESHNDTPLPKAKTMDIDHDQTILKDGTINPFNYNDGNSVYYAKNVDKNTQRKLRLNHRKKERTKSAVKSIDWIKKKEQRRRLGKKQQEIVNILVEEENQNFKQRKRKINEKYKKKFIRIR